MKTKLNLLYNLLSALFRAPANFANDGTPPGTVQGFNVPMSNGGFDFKKMVMSLLGLTDDTLDDCLIGKYNSAMGFAPDAGMKANAEAYDKAQADLAAANTKLAERKPRKVKLGAVEFDADLTDSEFKALDGAVAAANAAAPAADALNKRVVDAEGLAANARQQLVKVCSAVLIKEGRVTKAEMEATEKDLAANAADPAAFDKKLAELSKRTSAYGVASTIFAMLDNLGEGVSSKNTSQTAANEMQRLVAEEQKTAPDYTTAWSNVAKTDKGKSLMEQMKQPGQQPAAAK